MDDTAVVRFFTQPANEFQRRYEAMRAVFIDRRSQRDVAESFGFEYAAFRQLVCRLRQLLTDCSATSESPFFETPNMNALPKKWTIR